MYALRFKGQYDQATESELEGLTATIRAWLQVDHNEDGTHHVPAATSTRMVGEGLVWFTNTAPEKWLLCDGSQVSRTTYQALFELWGTTYGIGDGSTTFNVPNLQQRFPLGKAASGTGATLGATGGAIDHTHSGGSGTTGANGGFSTSTDSSGTGTTSTDNTGVILTASVTSPPDGPTVSAFGHTHSGPSHTHSVTVGDHTHSMSGGTTGTGNPPFIAVNYIVFAGV